MVLPESDGIFSSSDCCSCFGDIGFKYGTFGKLVKGSDSPNGLLSLSSKPGKRGIFKDGGAVRPGKCVGKVMVGVWKLGDIVSSALMLLVTTILFYI